MTPRRQGEQARGRDWAAINRMARAGVTVSEAMRGVRRALRQDPDSPYTFMTVPLDKTLAEIARGRG